MTTPNFFGDVTGMNKIIFGDVATPNFFGDVSIWRCDRGTFLAMRPIPEGTTLNLGICKFSRFFFKISPHMFSRQLNSLGLGIWWKFGLSVNRLIRGFVQLN